MKREKLIGIIIFIIVIFGICFFILQTNYNYYKTGDVTMDKINKNIKQIQRRCSVLGLYVPQEKTAKEIYDFAQEMVENDEIVGATIDETSFTITFFLHSEAPYIYVVNSWMWENY